MTITCFLLTMHFVGVYVLWRLQSDAAHSIIDIGAKDRCVALFWSPLLGWCLLHGLTLWVWDALRARRWFA